MKTINVSEATNTQLNWLVAKCEGVSVWIDLELQNSPRVMETPSNNVWGEPRQLAVEDGGVVYEPTTSGTLMVPIIERERISIRFWSNTETVHAYMPERDAEWVEGPTALIAAARCYIVSKLGETVEVPEELT